MAEPRIRVGEVRRNGVMPPAGDPGLRKRVGERNRVGGADHEEVPDRLTASGDLRKRKITDVGQVLQIPRSEITTPIIPPVERLEFRAESYRLERVEPRGVPLDVGLILLSLTMLAEGSWT